MLDDQGKPNQWLILDERYWRRLDEGKTLSENGIKHQHPLLLLNESALIELKIVSSGGLTKTIPLCGDTTISVPLRIAVKQFGLRQYDNDDQPIPWELRRERAGSPLEHDKTLSELGLMNGETLLLRRKSAPTEILKWVKPNLKVLLISTGGLAAAIILTILVWPRGHEPTKVPVIPHEAAVNPNEDDAIPLQPTLSRGETTRSQNKPMRVRNKAADGFQDMKGTDTAPVKLQPKATSRSPQYLAKAQAPPDPSPAFVVKPPTSSLGASDTVTFRVDPDPGAQVQWHLEPALGSISPAGVYTAPAVIPWQTEVNVTATPVASPQPPPGTSAPFASATVTLKPVLFKDVSCTQVDRKQYYCHTTVMYARNAAVTWSINPSLGTMNQQGIYIAPSNIPSSQTVAIIATSKSDPSRSAQYQLKLSAIPVPETSLAIKGPTQVTLTSGESTQFSAVVNGKATNNVTWSLSGPGTLSPFGRFQSPTVILDRGKALVSVTSLEDPSKQAVVEIELVPYGGPKSGTVTWEGTLNSDQVLTINGNQPNLGVITKGAFPAVPISARLLSNGCSIQTLPSEVNGWKTVEIKTTTTKHTIVVRWSLNPKG
jgi:hypothetical protein